MWRFSIYLFSTQSQTGRSLGYFFNAPVIRHFDNFRFIEYVREVNGKYGMLRKAQRDFGQPT